MRSAGIKGGWVAAGWFSVAAGLFDSFASFLHPAPLAVAPLSVTLFGLVGLSIHAVATAVVRLARTTGLRIPAGLPLGVVVGFWTGFFGAYFVTTSTLPFLVNGPGYRLGLLATVGVAVLAMLVTVRVTSAAGAETPGARAGRTRGVAAGWLLAAVILASPSLALFQQLRAHAPAAAGPPARGIVLVSLDAMRGDRVSGLGYPRPTTPHIDALLPTSLAFRRAYVEMPGSAPGHASMLSGLPPAAHGVRANTDVLPAEVLTMAERLRDAGFNTAAFIGNYYLESRYGFDQGFDTYINQYRATHVEGWHPRLLLRATSLFHFWHRLTRFHDLKSDGTIDDALAWLRHRPRGDFFVFLHVMDPHAPYAPPPDLRRRFRAAAADSVQDTPDLRRRFDELTPDQVQAMCDLYDGGVAQADRKVGRLIDELKRLGLFDSTLLVVTADHGEELADHGNVFDHGQLWNDNLQVPLVLSFPGHVPAGRVVEQPVSASAIAPTVMSLLGVPYEEQGGRRFHRSLLEPAPPFVFATGGIAGGLGACVMDDRHKLMMLEGRVVGFYDLIEDPQEQRDLSTAIAAGDTSLAWVRDARHLEAALLKWQAECRRGSLTDGTEALTDHDRETIRRLRSLGYVK